MIKISEFQSKDVINIADGKRLGRISDLELDLNQGRVRALVIPGSGKFFGFFSSGTDIVIPWSNIVKIGLDVILVRLEHRTNYNDSAESFEFYQPQIGSGKK
jgi:YlmC/YmxH family sporulation protein